MGTLNCVIHHPSKQFRVDIMPNRRYGLVHRSSGEVAGPVEAPCSGGAVAGNCSTVCSAGAGSVGTG